MAHSRPSSYFSYTGFFKLRGWIIVISSKDYRFNWRNDCGPRVVSLGELQMKVLGMESAHV